MLLQLVSAVAALALASAGSPDHAGSHSHRPALGAAHRHRPGPQRAERRPPGRDQQDGSDRQRRAQGLRHGGDSDGLRLHRVRVQHERRPEAQAGARGQGCGRQADPEGRRWRGPLHQPRAKIGNRFDADAAVSIHADGGPPSGRGFHVIYPTRIEGLTDDIYRPSRKLARVLRRSYAKRTDLPPSTYAGSDGLDRRSDLGGLRLSDVPKVFIETGNMQNAAEARLLQRDRVRRRIAKGIFLGLRRFLDA